MKSGEAKTKSIQKTLGFDDDGGIGEIARLHDEIVAAFRTNFDKAMRICELLTEVKAEMPHDGFGPWCAANLPFTDRTARDYMRLHRQRNRLKTETVPDLRTAYRLVTQTVEGPLHPFIDPYATNTEEHLPQD